LSTDPGAAREPIAPWRTHAPRRGCRIKPFRNSRSALAEEHARAAVRDDLATDASRAMDEVAVFGAHP
jgi:hypothetical protein